MKIFFILMAIGFGFFMTMFCIPMFFMILEEVIETWKRIFPKKPKPQIRISSFETEELIEELSKRDLTRNKTNWK